MAAITSAVVTTVATVGSAVYGAVKSNKQAKEARNDRKNAERAANRAYKEAAAGLDVNFYEGLSINKTPYELERDAMLATSANLIDAAQQGDERGVGASASRVLAASNQAQQDTTNRMSREMQNIDLKKRAEDSRLRDMKSDLALGKATGAQVAASNARNRESQATQNMHSSIQQGIGAVGQALPLFMPSGVAPGPAPYTSSVNQSFLNNSPLPTDYQSSINAVIV